MRNFQLKRVEDVSGVSGVGIVAEGIEFSDGTCVIRWIGRLRSTAIYDNVFEMLDIHGHEGKTVLVWRDNE